MANISVDMSQCYDRINHLIMLLVWLALSKYIQHIGVLLSCLQTMRVFEEQEIETQCPLWKGMAII